MNQSESTIRAKIAASSYLNTAPLIWSFLYGSNQEAVELFTHKAPSRCAEMLAGGEVDAALVPVIEYQRIHDVAIVPNVCVGSQAAVRSVVIATRENNLKNVKRVSLDNSSRTSVALVKIIFREFLGFEPQWQDAPPDLRSMLQESDAALIIGDPAMSISSEEFRIFDLATLWHDFTGVGFVFAMWMAARHSIEKVRSIDFASARDEGLANLSDIAARQTSLTGSAIEEYLTKNIVFEMNAERLRGLELFFELAVKHELIQRIKPLEFI
jgi:chorismate dehydratase